MLQIDTLYCEFFHPCSKHTKKISMWPIGKRKEIKRTIDVQSIKTSMKATIKEKHDKANIAMEKIPHDVIQKGKKSN